MRHITNAPRLDWRRGALALAVLAVLPLAGMSVGSDRRDHDHRHSPRVEQNISSLSSVIERNPNSPEAYNVRGSAYGRAGKYSEALRDFDRRSSLIPIFIRPMPTAP